MQLVNWSVTKRPPLTPKSRLICILPNKRQLGLKTTGLMLKIDAVEKNLEGHLSGHGRLERDEKVLFNDANIATAMIKGLPAFPNVTSS